MFERDPRVNGVDPVAPELLQEAAGMFGLLASSARLQIVWLLAHGEQDVGTLAEAVGMALPAVSQHLTKLKLAGLVNARREGRRQVYVLEDPRVAAAVRQMVGGLSPTAAHGPGAARHPGTHIPGALPAAVPAVVPAVERRRRFGG